jgi:hypothetical protein
VTEPTGTPQGAEAPHRHRTVDVPGIVAVLLIILSVAYVSFERRIRLHPRIWCDSGATNYVVCQSPASGTVATADGMGAFGNVELVGSCVS